MTTSLRLTPPAQTGHEPSDLGLNLSRGLLQVTDKYSLTIASVLGLYGKKVSGDKCSIGRGTISHHNTSLGPAGISIADEELRYLLAFVHVAVSRPENLVYTADGLGSSHCGDNLRSVAR